MLKITIDNEEVLCDKDFTINEEMLNTSSVILNNVYPKTWEQDKDYVSRFYYPKDYSKCRIYEETIHPADPGTTIENTSMSITYDNSKKWDYFLKGQTSQNGTPTPSSPIPINITTGRQVVSVCGKNLLNTNTFVKGRIDPANGNIQYPDGITDFSTTNNSISFTSNATWRGVASDFIPITTGNYYFTMSVSTTSSKLYAYVDYYDNQHNYISRLGNYSYVNGDTKTWLLNLTEQNASFIRIHFQMQQIGTTTITNPMLSNSDTTYEEYKGNDYEINLGKNLFNVHSGTTITSVNVQYTRNDDGTITLNGTSNNTGYVEILYDFKNGTTQQSTPTLILDSSSTYTASFKSLSGTSSTTDVRFITQYNSTGSQATIYVGNSQTISNSDGLYRAYIRIPSGATFTDYVVGIQVEKGSSASSFTPYKTPIYLGKIGTYQDRIFKNTTDNPYYDNTLSYGDWYIHKEVGRVVLNGSESWSDFRTYGNYYRIATNITDARITTTNDSDIYSNYFYGNVGVLNSSLAELGMVAKYRNTQTFYFETDQTSNANFKTWLSSHNVEVYYILNTPTNTLIEDEELINQLNSIELLEGLNNVSVSSADLPALMNLHYNFNSAYTTYDLYFTGIVKNTGDISLNPRYPHYCNVQVLSFKDFLSQGETLDFVITDKTIEEAIDQVIGTIAPYGFIKGNIQLSDASDLMGTYSTKDKTAYDVFNYIADITQSRWRTRMIDESTIAIDFYDPNQLPQGTAIEYTQEWFCNNKINDMSYSYSSNDYRNKQVMLSGEVFSNIETTEIIVADGYQTQFNTIDKIGYVSSILLNGTPKTIITKDEENLGYEGDFVFQPGEMKFESTTLVSTGGIITITYYAIIEGREVLLNQDEIARIETNLGRKGIIARYETRNDATTTAELQAIGQSYLKYKGIPEITLKVSTRSNIWDIGERVYFNAPLDELKQEYMVKRKTIERIATIDELFYEYELTSSFNMERDINYFDNQRYKSRGNIGEGEFISRNIDIENTANVCFYALEVNEVQVSGTSSLQAGLQTPLGVE